MIFKVVPMEEELLHKILNEVQSLRELVHKNLPIIYEASHNVELKQEVKEKKNKLERSIDRAFGKLF